MCGFRKNAENLRFWAFLTILAPNGQFWTDAAQNDQISNFPEKNKNATFIHSLRLAFMQKIRKVQCAVSEKIWRTETRERDRDEGEFIGPNPPGGRRTKNEFICL